MLLADSLADRAFILSRSLISADHAGADGCFRDPAGNPRNHPGIERLGNHIAGFTDFCRRTFRPQHRRINFLQGFQAVRQDFLAGNLARALEAASFMASVISRAGRQGRRGKSPESQQLLIWLGNPCVRCRRQARPGGQIRHDFRIGLAKTMAARFMEAIISGVTQFGGAAQEYIGARIASAKVRQSRSVARASLAALLAFCLLILRCHRTTFSRFTAR